MANVQLGKVGLTPKDLWSSSLEYEKLDIVVYDGESYIAKKDVPIGVSVTTGTEYWQLFSKKGNGMSVGKVISVTTTQPLEEENKLWIREGYDEEFDVLTTDDIDDTAGERNYNVIWSAGKTWNEINDLKNQLRYYENNANANFENLDYLCTIFTNANDADRSHYRMTVPTTVSNKYIGIGIKGNLINYVTKARFFKLTYTYDTDLDDSLWIPTIYKNSAFTGECYIEKPEAGKITALIKFSQTIANNEYVLPAINISSTSTAGYIEITSCHIEDITGTNAFDQSQKFENIKLGKEIIDITSECIIGETITGTGIATKTGNKVTFSGGTYSGQKYIAVIINNASTISKIRNKKLLISIDYDIYGDIKNSFIPRSYASSTNITIDALLCRDNNLMYLLDIPETGSISYILTGLQNQDIISNANSIENGNYIEITNYSVYILTESSSEDTDIDTTELKLEDTYCRLKEPTFFAENLSGLSTNTETRTVTATETVTANNIYVGYRYNDNIAFYNGAIIELQFTVTTTGTTEWNLYSSNTTSNKFEKISQKYKDGIVTLRYKIFDATATSFMYFYMRTSTFNNGDTITIGEPIIKDISVRNTIDRRYADCTLTCFGDSYTMMQRWQYIVCNELFMRPFSDAWGQSGGTLTSIYTQISTVNTDADVLTIWIGTNDYAGSRSVGDINDTEATIVNGYTTFCGALNYVCNWISNNMKGKTIVFITPTFRYNGTDQTLEQANGTDAKGYVKNNAGYTLEDFANAMIAVANKWGYPCLDLFHNSGINKNSFTAYYDSDNLHPSWKGAKPLAHKIAEFIRQQ